MTRKWEAAAPSSLLPADQCRRRALAVRLSTAYWQSKEGCEALPASPLPRLTSPPFLLLPAAPLLLGLGAAETRRGSVEDAVRRVAGQRRPAGCAFRVPQQVGRRQRPSVCALRAALHHPPSQRTRPPLPPLLPVNASSSPPLLPRPASPPALEPLPPFLPLAAPPPSSEAFRRTSASTASEPPFGRTGASASRQWTRQSRRVRQSSQQRRHPSAIARGATRRERAPRRSALSAQPNGTESSMKRRGCGAHLFAHVGQRRRRRTRLVSPSPAGCGSSGTGQLQPQVSIRPSPAAAVTVPLVQLPAGDGGLRAVDRCRAVLNRFPFSCWRQSSGCSSS